jgi:hypothetical protein
MNQRAASLILLLVCPVPALAEDSAPPITFPQVTNIPVPFQSISGRWSALNPHLRSSCRFNQVLGRAVSTRLILVKELDCGQGAQIDDVLVNVELSDPADTVQMIRGRRVVVKGQFHLAREYRAAMSGWANYFIAEKAALVAGDPRGAPAPAFMSYMVCQPPELDALAVQLGHELCVQSTLLADLTQARPALETAARAPAKLSPDDKVPGDADTISCRLDPGLSDPQLQAVACARGGYWAWYKAGWGKPVPAGLAPP